MIFCLNGLPAQVGPLRETSLGKISTREITELLPRRARDKWVFRFYDHGKNVKWAKSWTRKVNLTGIAWDKPSNGVLITPVHMLLTRHMGRRTDKPVYFHDKEGKLIERNIISYFHVGGKEPSIDLLLVRLDRPVPLPHYRVLPPRIDWEDSLVGELALITTDKDRKLTVAQIGRIGGGRVAFAKSNKVDEFYQSKVVVGDSANPSFLLINGEPILIEIHSTGGWGSGPFLSDPVVFAKINESLKELGGDYQLDVLK